jgi:CRISPR/Cas system-associated exonuclease Cas4 (RecB family)
LWSLFAPAVGQENWHCDMKRGFIKARGKETAIAQILKQDNIPQRIGHLAQRGVYEFHQDHSMLNRSNALQIIAEKLQLNQEKEQVQERVHFILSKYQENPILKDKHIIHLTRGDEGFPQPIQIQQGNYLFNLYAAIDCIFTEDDILHILDFKTGKTDFDLRQGLVYLLAVRYLYPHQPAIASFYNLETSKWSKPISATNTQLKAVQIEIVQVAKQHQNDIQRYRKNIAAFNQIFPPNPGRVCQHCQFKSACEFSRIEVTA